jgi:hypothetical protein
MFMRVVRLVRGLANLLRNDFLEKCPQEDSKFMLKGRIRRRRFIKSGEIDLSIPLLKCV